MISEALQFTVAMLAISFHRSPLTYLFIQTKCLLWDQTLLPLLSEILSKALKTQRREQFLWQF